MSEGALKKYRRICSIGPLIHNSRVVEDLSQRGLKVVKGLSGVRKGAVLISSHGISPKTASRITSRRLAMVDTTCPFVLNAQKAAARMRSEGYSVVIVGDSKHPEVMALMDFASGDVKVVKDEHEAAGLGIGKGSRVSVLSQTTQSPENFLKVVKVILGKKPGELRVFNTICSDAEERQEFARRLAGKVDLMLIMGGRNSANTKRLLEVCRKVQKNSRLIETDRELRKAWFDNRVRVVGIASGASTPDRVVREAVKKIHRKGVV
jgi:4-hydroxy-3-methylbut-2-enyl diphosphate reductase